MKSHGDIGGCYPPRPTASTDNTLLDLHNSSKDTQPHSLIVNDSESDDINREDNDNEENNNKTRVKLSPNFTSSSFAGSPCDIFSQFDFQTSIYYRP